MKTASTDEVGAAAPSRSMKIYFCDICNESIPLRDINSNRISIEEGRIFCANCAPKKAKGAAPAPVLLWATVVLLAAGLVVVGVLGNNAQGGLRDDLASIRTQLDTERRALAAAERRGDLAEAEARAMSTRLGELADSLQRIEGRIDQRVSALESTETRHHEELRSDLLAGLERLRASLEPRVLEAERGIAEVTRLGRSSDLQLAHLEKRLDLLSERTGEAAAPGPATRPAEGPGPTPEAGETRVKTPDEERADREVTALLSGLDDKDAGVRFSSVIELGNFDRPEVASGVERLLDDSVDFVRKAAVQTLRRLGRKSSIPRLIGALRDSDYLVRLAARDALRALAGTGFGFDPDANPSEREKKVKEWEAWWAANKAALAETPAR